MIRSFFPIVMMVFLIFLGCSRDAAVILDMGYSMDVMDSDLPVVVSTFPDIPAILRENGISSKIIHFDSENRSMEEELNLFSGDLLVWSALMYPKSVEFHGENPEKEGILLSFTQNPKQQEVENLTIVYPSYENAWDELATIVESEGYERVSAVISEYVYKSSPRLQSFVLDSGMDYIIVKEGDSSSRGQTFLKNQLTNDHELVIIASREFNDELIDYLSPLKTPFFVDVPYPGIDDVETIYGYFILPWEKGIESALEADASTSDAIGRFEAKLYKK